MTKIITWCELRYYTLAELEALFRTLQIEFERTAPGSRERGRARPPVPRPRPPDRGKQGGGDRRRNLPGRLPRPAQTRERDLPDPQKSKAVAIDSEIFQDAYLVPLKPESEICLIPKIGGGAPGSKGRAVQLATRQWRTVRDGEPVPAYDQAADDRMGQPARVLIPKIGGG